MSASHIETDRGLTSRMFLTGAALVSLWVCVSFLLFRLAAAVPFVVVIMVRPDQVITLTQYWFSTRIAMFSMHAKEVTPEQESELHAMVGQR